jgi:hypothetical protein
MAAFASIFRTFTMPTLLCLSLALVSTGRLMGAETEALKADAQAYFKGRVTPFVTTYCLPCHQNRRPTQAGVNFSPALNSPGHAAFTDQWKRAAARIKAHDMPPRNAPQPSEADRLMFVDWMAKLKYLSQQDPGPFVIRRLTKTEFGNTLRDLYGVETSIVDGLPDEVSGEGYLNSLSPLQLEQYLKIADQVLSRIIAPAGSAPTRLQRKLFGAHAVNPRQVARSLAGQAYRRPPTEAELDVLVAAYNLGRQNKLAHAQSLHLMFKAVLVSPQFLFITPGAEAASSTGIVPLEDYQLASRLSYLLWATMPDEELMTLASKGTIHEPAVLKAQVKRLLADRRSRALFDGFGAQWLSVGGLQRQVFDPALFPQMNGEMRQAMYNEVRLFFESIVRENKSVLSFINSDYTYLNGSLAAIYGLDKTVKGPAMRRVALSDSNRGGVLGMPGILAATSFPNRTSPVKRGIWVLEQLLGEHVPAAPPNVPALDEQDQKSVANLTVRQRTELHRTNPVCANCHKILDPIGFGLENFDAIGQWRSQDRNGTPIDATGELPGGKLFSGPKDLKTIIAGRGDALARNLVEKLMAYALGRRLEGYDEIVVDNLMSEISKDGYRMQTLIEGVITSYPFTHRRIVRKEDLP